MEWMQFITKILGAFSGSKKEQPQQQQPLKSREQMEARLAELLAQKEERERRAALTSMIPGYGAYQKGSRIYEGGKGIGQALGLWK